MVSSLNNKKASDVVNQWMEGKKKSWFESWRVNKEKVEGAFKVICNVLYSSWILTVQVFVLLSFFKLNIKIPQNSATKQGIKIQKHTGNRCIHFCTYM